ncbi:MAG: hypothetical protein FWE16_02725 [Firmicutes bacterium]|nr:hypothetical protein [Bacillota bacterium]
MNQFYCGRCKIVFEGEEARCKCGKKRLKPPVVNDIMFLTFRIHGPTSGMLEDLLEQHEIPFMRQESRGGVPGAAFGKSSHFDYFVPFGAYAKAKELDEIVPR